MPLTAGTRLGSYLIEALIGAGGMGEVYRARDTKLDRDVALKVLPAALTSDPEGLLRFVRSLHVATGMSRVLYSLRMAMMMPGLSVLSGWQDRPRQRRLRDQSGSDADRELPIARWPT